MYKLCIKDSELDKKFTLILSAGKEHLENICEDLNKYFNSIVGNNKISLKDFLDDESNTYYLTKVLDYHAPGIEALVIVDGIRVLANRQNIVISENSCIVRKAMRKYKH